MSARKPRTSFTAPLVMTLAVAPACIVSSSPTHQPTGTGNGNTVDRRTPTDDHTNDPHQSPPVDQQSITQVWRVYMQPTNDCRAMEESDCPAGATCNPPPPVSVACPAGITVDQPLRVEQHADGTCFVAYAAPVCPPDTACNPPRPREVDCPTR